MWISVCWVYLYDYPGLAYIFVVFGSCVAQTVCAILEYFFERELTCFLCEVG